MADERNCHGNLASNGRIGAERKGMPGDQAGLVVLVIAAHLVGLAGKFSSFPFGVVIDLIVALLVAGLFFRRPGEKERFRWSSVTGAAILVWFAYNVCELANPWAESRLVWFYCVRAVSLVLFTYFVFCYRLISEKLISFYLNLWIGLGVACALYAIHQRYGGFFEFEIDWLKGDPLKTGLYFINGQWRIFSVFLDPVAFAYNMSVTALLCLCLAFGPGSPVRRLVFFLLGSLLIWTMLFSGVRAAYIMTAAGLAFIILLNLSFRALAVCLLTALLCTSFFFIYSSNHLVTRFKTVFSPMDDASFRVRLNNQEQIKPYIRSHPIGAGLGSTGEWGKRFSAGTYLASFPPDSGYVRVAVEQGWIGLLLFCTVVFVVIVSGIRNFFRLTDPKLKNYCLAMTAAVFALNAGNYPQEAFVLLPISVYFCLAAAIITMAPVIEREADNLPQGRQAS